MNRSNSHFKGYRDDDPIIRAIDQGTSPQDSDFVLSVPRRRLRATRWGEFVPVGTQLLLDCLIPFTSATEGGAWVLGFNRLVRLVNGSYPCNSSSGGFRLRTQL